MNNERIIYYTDELNDEFSEAKIKPRIIDEKYKYVHKSPIWNTTALLVHQVLSLPIKYLYAKLKFNLKIIGKEKYKQYGKQGFFIYGNHTQSFGDTFFISNSVYPKRNYIIVNPENVSMKGMKNLVQMLGAIPIPNKRKGMRKFLNTIKTRIEQGHSITIFPEAHIWPYYTKIRPFKSVSFKYPVKLNVPVFCATNTYQTYGKRNKIKMVMYIDGPFLPDMSLESKQRQEDLRNRVYEIMCERSKNSNVEYIKYLKDNKNK